MKIWVVVSRSCSTCNSMGVASYHHEPTEEEIVKVEREIGGMWCIDSEKFHTEVNGQPVTDDTSD